MTYLKKDILLFAIPLATFVTVNFILGFDGLYGQDSYAYAQQAREIKDMLLGGGESGSFFWPRLYPMLGALVSLTGVKTAFSLQLVSTLSLILLSVYMIKMMNAYKREQKMGFWFLLVAMIASPFLLRSSIIVMSDLTAAAFVTAFAWHVKQYRRRYKIGELIWASVFAFCALFTRYPSFFILLPGLLWLMYAIVSARQFKHLWVVVIPGAMFLGYLALFGMDSIDTTHPFLSRWEIGNLFKSSFCTTEGCMDYRVPNIVYILFPFGHPGFSILTAVILILIRKRFMTQDWYWLSLVAGYMIFLAGLPFQNNRFLILIFPIIIMWVYPKFNSLKVSNFILSLVLAIAFIIQSAFSGYYLEQFASRNKLEKEVSAYMQKLEPSTVYGFDLDIALAYRVPAHTYMNIWHEPIDSFKSGAYVLVNVENINDQWKGHNPEINLSRLQSEYQLQLITGFKGGFKLYKIVDQ